MMNGHSPQERGIEGGGALSAATCFTPGVAIATPRGERLIEELRVGDRVITRDNGIQSIRWVGVRTLTTAELARAPHLRPVLIVLGALGHRLPERDMRVSPNHRLLVNRANSALYFDEPEALVAAKHLVGLPGVTEAPLSEVTYIFLMFDRHEVVLSNGCWTESFQPADHSLKGIGNAQRAELFELFPDLRVMPQQSGAPTSDVGRSHPGGASLPR